jgi:hypothetical protein
MAESVGRCEPPDAAGVFTAVSLETWGLLRGRALPMELAASGEKGRLLLARIAEKRARRPFGPKTATTLISRQM